jgi:SAM-dependent MidA family methyltransferase
LHTLNEIIRQAIAEASILSFADFMSLALYHPQYGYYERDISYIGKRGDFFTSVSVGELFGTLLAAQFATWHAKSPTSPWQVLEAGAHDGQLAKDILTTLRDNSLGTESQFEYWILEPSARRQARQQETLCEFASLVRWFPGWDALPATGVHGVIFANELLDAFPVHRYGWGAEQQAWFEWGVTYQNSRFTWAKMALATDKTPIWEFYPSFKELSGVLPPNYAIEVCPQAVAWWQQAAQALRSGRLLTLDYGLSVEQLFMPERSDGTIKAYYRHHINPDLLAYPGEQDLTAPVNWTWLQKAGERAGLKTEGFMTQAQFLTRIVETTCQTHCLSLPWTGRHLRQFQTLTHPEHFGHTFRVLIQNRMESR